MKPFLTLEVDMKRLLVLCFAALAGCATPGHDYTLSCDLSLNGKCLQVSRFESLYSVQQDRTKP